MIGDPQTHPYDQYHPSQPGPAPKPKRRSFSPGHELRIATGDDASPAGDKGAILLRERLYSSQVIEWRPPCDTGSLTTLTDKRTRPARHARQMRGSSQ